MAARSRERRAAAKVLKVGILSAAEKAMVATVAQSDPHPTQVTALAVAMQRKPSTIRKSIQQAREEFQASAMDYVRAHKKVLDSGDPDVARKAAQWAIEHMSHRDDKGNVERIVEASEGADDRPSIQIGINLGGVPRHPDAIDAEVEETDNAAE